MQNNPFGNNPCGPGFHLMLDLETMGVESDAAIVAIGAVAFQARAAHPEGGNILSRFGAAVDLSSSIAAGGTVSGDTVYWWLEQPAKARGELLKEPEHIYAALRGFADWVMLSTNSFGPLTAVWGNGANFDPVVLRNAYAASKLTAPWSFRQERCYRTMRWVADSVTAYDDPRLERHVAVDDAEFQARHLLKIWKQCPDLAPR